MARKLSALLINDNVVSIERMEEALQRQVVFGGRLGTNLLEMGVISEGELLHYLALAHGLMPADASNYADLDPDALALLSRERVRGLGILPIRLHADGTADALVLDPVAPEVLAELRDTAGFEFILHITPEFRFRQALEKFFDVPLPQRLRRLLERYPADFSVGNSSDLGAPSQDGGPTWRENPLGVGWTLDELGAYLEECYVRDVILAVLLGFAASFASRRMLLVSARRRLQGYAAAGPGVQTPEVRKVRLRVRADGSIDRVCSGTTYYQGPPGEGELEPLYTALGLHPPRNCVLLPIPVGPRAALVLLMDHGATVLEPAALEPLFAAIGAVSEALERIIRLTKSGELPPEELRLPALPESARTGEALRRVLPSRTPSSEKPTRELSKADLGLAVEQHHTGHETIDPIPPRPAPEPEPTPEIAAAEPARELQPKPESQDTPGELELAGALEDVFNEPEPSLAGEPEPEPAVDTGREEPPADDVQPKDGDDVVADEEPDARGLARVPRTGDSEAHTDSLHDMSARVEEDSLSAADQPSIADEFGEDLLNDGWEIPDVFMSVDAEAPSVIPEPEDSKAVPALVRPDRDLPRQSDSWVDDSDPAGEPELDLEPREIDRGDQKTLVYDYKDHNGASDPESEADGDGADGAGDDTSPDGHTRDEDSQDEDSQGEDASDEDSQDEGSQDEDSQDEDSSDEDSQDEDSSDEDSQDEDSSDEDSQDEDSDGRSRGESPPDEGAREETVADTQAEVGSEGDSGDTIAGSTDGSPDRSDDDPDSYAEDEWDPSDDEAGPMAPTQKMEPVSDDLAARLPSFSGEPAPSVDETAGGDPLRGGTTPLSEDEEAELLTQTLELTALTADEAAAMAVPAELLDHHTVELELISTDGLAPETEAALADYRATVHTLCTGDAEEKVAARAALLDAGERALPALLEQFPGPITVDRYGFAPAKLPPLENHGPLLDVLVEMGDLAAPAIASILDMPGVDVRFYGTFYFGRVRYDPALIRLSERLFDKDPSIREMARHILRSMRASSGFAKVLQYVREGIRSRDAWRQQEAALAAGMFGDQAATPHLVQALESDNRRLVEVAHRVLVQITFEDLGPSHKKWARWWEKHGTDDRNMWLLEGMNHSSREIRQNAARELAHFPGLLVNYSADSSRRERLRAQKVVAQYLKETT